MGSVINAIVDVFEAVIAISFTISLIGPLLAQVSPEFKDWYVDALAPVMSILGIEDTDVISAQVTDQLLLQDEGIKNLLTKVALAHQDSQQGIIELLSQYGMRARSSMDNYFTYGLNEYYNGLPDTNVRAITIPDVVYTIIATEYGTPVNPINSAVKVPTKVEYLSWKLNKLYSYQTWTNSLTYSGYTYEVKYMDYNYSTDKYDVTIYREATEQVNTTTETIITIVPYSNPGYVLYDNSTNYAIDDYVTYLGDDYRCIVASIGNLPTDNAYWEQVNFDTKYTRTIITEYTVHSITGTTSVVVYDNDPGTITYIAVGSEVDSYSSSTIYGPIINVEYDTTVLPIDAYAPKSNYVIQWYATDSGHIMYWCYEIGSGITVLDESSGRYVAQLEMLPIIELRNNKHNINENVLSEAYLDSKEILRKVGIDIDQTIVAISENPSIADITNAYIYFGVNASDTSAVVAKYLFSIFEFLYDQNMQDPNTHKYAAYTTEGNYNSIIIWKEQTRSIHTGIIGSINYCTSTVVGNTLVLRRQATESQYIEFNIVDIGATTFIYEGGMWATVQKIAQNGELIIPVSRHLANALTPLEQMELFQKSLRIAIYAATIVHLEWYQTPEFFDFMKIVLIVVVVVLTAIEIMAGCADGCTISQAFKAFALPALYAMGAAYALKLLLELTDNPYLKALIAVTAIIAGSLYGGFYDLDSVIFMTADQWTNIVTEYYNTKLEDILITSAAFTTMATDRMQEIENKLADYRGYLDTEFVAELQHLEETKAYIEGPSLNMYRAVALQKDVYDLVKDQYSNMFEYDKYYQVNVQNY